LSKTAEIVSFEKGEIVNIAGSGVQTENPSSCCAGTNSLAWWSLTRSRKYAICFGDLEASTPFQQGRCYAKVGRGEEGLVAAMEQRTPLVQAMRSR
jgi:hypothetical protein